MISQKQFSNYTRGSASPLTAIVLQKNSKKHLKLIHHKWSQGLIFHNLDNLSGLEGPWGAPWEGLQDIQQIQLYMG